MAQEDGQFWVFAYGSLLWNPDFAFEEAAPARLHGWHRRMCILSIRYRGQPDRPGLVLGLDRGGCCRGLVYRIAAERSATVRRNLEARELITGVYHPLFLPTRLDDGRRVAAFAFVARRDHPQYAGRMPPERAAQLIRQGVGGNGSSRDYLADTVCHLNALGLPDGPLTRLLRLVDQAACAPTADQAGSLRT